MMIRTIRGAMVAALTCLPMLAALPGTAAAAGMERQTFSVVGTWSNLSVFKELEAPMWTRIIPEASGGQITGNIQAINTLGLGGLEVVKLIKSGVYDLGFGSYSYIASGDAVFEGIDLALTPADAAETRRMVEAYEPVVREAFARIHGIHLLASYPFPAQSIGCREAFSSIDDLRGRKIRVFSTTLGDMAEGLGAVPVSMPFPDVAPALQRGVIDCAVSGALSMYVAQWTDVVKYIYQVPASGGIAFLAIGANKWNSLTPETRNFLGEQAAAFSTRAWDALDASNEQGLACLTGQGAACTYGKPASVTLVETTPADDARRRALLEDVVLKKYAARCGAACTEQWNATIGAALSLTAAE